MGQNAIVMVAKIVHLKIVLSNLEFSPQFLSLTACFAEWKPHDTLKSKQTSVIVVNCVAEWTLTLK